MPLSTKVVLPLAALLAISGWLFLRLPGQEPTPETVPTETIKLPVQLAPLGIAPDWHALKEFQGSITRAEFERLLTTVFTTGDAWRNFITLSDQEAVIAMEGAESDKKFQLRFATAPDKEEAAPRHWRTTRELPPATPEKPLAGLRIALDAGHIGGAWAKMEERRLEVDGFPAIQEGDLTLAVARLLKPQLEALGANVTMVRDSLEPLTPLRPTTLTKEAAVFAAPGEDIHKVAERLFYRTAEIRARADLVNLKLKPDLVVCLHFNAEPWSPVTGAFSNTSHFHILLNGSYNDAEVAMADQRYEMLRKLLTRTHAEEASLGADVAAAVYSASGLPPYTYWAGSKNARTVDGNPYLWARNLIANRLYDCPVIYMEPYVMNSTHDYARLQAGDYEGLRDIGGKMQPSILREYAGAVAEGLRQHYLKARVK